ncbi:hypothetical protein SDC9_187147 [bioreactor metagenome]|uniref:Uncharacterized protein n=1 Tax=bioreactor metagenome TaxID=1076179 RepID=A0A645HMZ4_9ZZZZ
MIREALPALTSCTALRHASILSFSSTISYPLLRLFSSTISCIFPLSPIRIASAMPSSHACSTDFKTSSSSAAATAMVLGPIFLAYSIICSKVSIITIILYYSIISSLFDGVRISHPVSVTSMFSSIPRLPTPYSYIYGSMAKVMPG